MAKRVVNDLIQNTLRQCNVVGDGQSANGNQVTNALEDLNSAISELNNDEYLLFNVHQYDVQGKTVKIGPASSYDIVVAEAPMTIKCVSRKIGDRYIPLTIVNKETLDTSVIYGAYPTAYAVETEYDSDNDCMVTIVRLNGSNFQGIRLTFLEEMPEYDVNDTINLPRTYLNLIEEALCVKTCKRYKLEFISMYTDDLDKMKEQIERINNSNRPLVIDGAVSGSYLDSYYDGLGGTTFSL